MSENIVTAKLNGADAEIALADLANIDMSGIKENEGGFEPTPKGAYHFRCSDAELTSISTDKGERAIIRFSLEIKNVLSFVDSEINPNDWIGKTHEETIFISDVEKGIGQAKCLMTNAGFTATGSLTQLLDAFVGTEFQAPIAQRKDKNDPDRIYANLKFGKIVPYVGEQEASAVGGGIGGGLNIGS